MLALYISYNYKILWYIEHILYKLEKTNKVFDHNCNIMRTVNPLA